MVVVQATKLSLPNPSLSSPQVSSLLFEPLSLSLALMHSDSSFSIYPSFSPLSLSSLPSPQLIVPSPCSSAAFVSLRTSNSNSDSKVMFVVSGPHKGGSQILLRFYVLEEACKLFRRVRVVCTHKDLRSDDKLGVLVDFRHGLSVRLAGSVNFFAMYSVSSLKIWVFAVKMVGGGDASAAAAGMGLKLMRCAVIDCCKPIWSISISFGFLLLGEDNGVRVVNLRPFVRGRGRKVMNLNANNTASNAKREVQKSFLTHGEVCGTSGGTDLNGCSLVVANNGFNAQAGRSDDAGTSAICNGYLDGKLDKHSISVRPRSVKLRQDSSEGGLYFVALKGRGIEDLKSAKMMSSKAISIQALSPKKFLILDSVGDLHLLHLASTANGSDFSCNIRPLPHLMKVQMLTSVTDTCTRNQTVCLSDGHHSAHVMVIPDVDSDVTENRGNESEEVLMQRISAMQVIFVGEKIQDITSLAANAVLILGQVLISFKQEAYMRIQFPEVSLRTFSFKAVLNDLFLCGGFSASCSAQILAMWSLIIVTVSQYQESQELQFSHISMVHKIQEDSALNRTTLGNMLLWSSEILKREVFQQLKATRPLCCLGLGLASMSCKTSLGPRNEHASCWLFCFVASLVQQKECRIFIRPAIMKDTTQQRPSVGFTVAR